jgi:hypothetical protein
MNTPKKKKPPKRWSSTAVLSTNIPAGQYTGSIDDPAFLLRLGAIAVRWPHIEEAMISLFADLIGGDDATLTARQLSVPIFSVHRRLMLMKSMLENGRRNRDKQKEYDMLLEELEASNNLRNDYIHGVWNTHDSGKVFLHPPNVRMFPVTEAREVTTAELDQFIARLGRLAVAVRFITPLRSPPSPETLP